MNREVFEYFFDVAELEPYYSELPVSVVSAGSQRIAESSCSEDRTKTAAEPGKRIGEPGFRDAFATQREGIAAPKRPANAVEIRGECDLARETVVSPAQAETKATSTSDADGTFDDRTRLRRLVSVHALGQYVFCARSAILAMENDHEQDIDEPPPRLTYLPCFDRERIEELLSEKLRGLGLSFLYAASLVILMIASAIRQERVWFYPPMFLSIAYLYWFAITLVAIARLAERRRSAIHAEAGQPDPRVTGIQNVNWWSMLKASFEPVNYRRPFRHPELPLEGCPWRVLERGSIRIPVIRSGIDKLGLSAGELYPKHLVRLTAYALLLESTGHHEVPFGLVFPADSPKGLAVRITPALREKTVHSLHEFVDKLHSSQRNQVEPRPPDNRNRCARCTHGEPETISVSEVEATRKSGAPILVLHHGRGICFHCQCGDRFGSAPPHAKSLKLGLAAALD